MQLRRRLTVLVTGVLLTLGAGTAPSALASAQPQPSARHSAKQPVLCPVNGRETVNLPGPGAPPMVPQRFFLNDWRLGPKELPRKWPLGPMMFGYQRLDHTNVQNFLTCYWDPTQPNWWYPKANGFLLDSGGNPIERPVTLQAGQFVDLFGSGTGRFLAPAGTLYAYRAIPPSNLDTYDPRYPFNYHLYRVLAPFSVEAGPAAPWFGQPGGGLQYYTGGNRVSQLVQTGFLQEIPVLPAVHPHWPPREQGPHTLPVRPKPLPGHEQHVLPGQDQHLLPGQEQHALPGQDQHALPGQEQHALPGQEQHALPGQDQHALPGRGQAVLPGRGHHSSGQSAHAHHRQHALR